MNNHCRISRVFPKSGGVIERLRLPERDEEQRRMRSASHDVAGFFTEGELAGYVVIGWARDGAYSVAFHERPGVTAVPKTLLPSWTGEVVRRTMIENGAWK